MSASIEIQGLREVQALLNSFPQRAKTIISRSLNDAAKHTVTFASQQVYKQWQISSKGAKAGINVTRATPENLTAVIEVTGKGIPLLFFKAKQTAKGVSYAIPKGRGRKLVPSGFIAEMRPSGHRGVYIRHGRKVVPTRGSYAGRKIKRGPRKGEPILRQKIREKIVVSYRAMYRDVWPDVERDAKPFLINRIRQQLARALENRR